MSHEKLQTMIMQKFGGVKKVYYGICAFIRTLNVKISVSMKQTDYSMESAVSTHSLFLFRLLRNEVVFSSR